MHGKRLLLLTTSSSMQALPKEEGKEESEYDNEAKDEGENEEESSESESDESSDSYAAISEFLNDSVAPYTGGPMSIDDARATLGLDRYQADAVIGYLSSYSNDSGLITKIQVHLAILSLLGESYVSFPMQERAKSNFILDRLFSSFDPTNTGRCYLRDIGCALLLFCGGSGASRAHAAFALLVLLESRFDSRSSSSPATVDFLHLLVVVKSVASLFKAAKCLDPAVIPEDCAYGDHLAAKQALQYFMAQDRDKDSDAIIEEYQTVYLEDFTNLFTAMIALLESDSLGIDLSLLPSPPAKKLNHFLKDELDLNWPDSMDSEDDDQEAGLAVQLHNIEDVETDSYDSSSDSEEDYGDDDFEDLDEDEESDGDSDSDTSFLNDAMYPPSAVVLELRAAQAMLGLEGCTADDMMESLGQHSEQGVLDLHAWLSWLQKQIATAAYSKIWEEDIDLGIAMNLGTKLFEAFSKSEAESTTHNGHISSYSSSVVLFSRLAVGLAFLCGQSPLADKVMVAFTMVDEDSDGAITREEFQSMILSTLITVTVCSKLAANKVVSTHAALAELADAATKEAVVAMGEQWGRESVYEGGGRDGDLSLDSVCNVAVDFLKLAAIY